MTSIIVPIGICVVLPVMLVWLVTRVRRNEIDKKAEVMIKAIQSGVTNDSDVYKERSVTDLRWYFPCGRNSSFHRFLCGPQDAGKRNGGRREVSGAGISNLQIA